MRVPPESYKGIEYIRISSLPDDQKKYLNQTLHRRLIINILKDDALMNDCLQYKHYITWYEKIYKAEVQENKAATQPIEVSSKSPIFTLALK